MSSTVEATPGKQLDFYDLVEHEHAAHGSTQIGF